MLKIIRKYQLIILAIGGSLLMVVFLFQPILGKISPDPRKSTVAKLTDGTTFNGLDFQRASFDLSMLKRVYPRVFAPFDQGGLGLQAGSGDDTERHWLLLTKQAQDAGLIGESGEGRNWIPLIAQREAATLIQQQMRQGLFTSQEQANQALNDMTFQIENALQRNVSLATGMMRGITEDDVYRTLATARGIERLYRVFTSMPAYSDLGAMHAAKDRFDAVAVDAVLIKADLFADSIQYPSDDELEAFFDIYKADAATDNDYKIGYTQPTRAKIGWLTLSRLTVEAAVVIDRVELNKIWRTDHTLPEGSRKYPGDFSGERLNIEVAYRVDRAQAIMIEADKIIRSQVLQATRGLSKDGQFLILPEDWDTKRPTLEAMAQAVVDGLKTQLSVTIPLPAVEIRTDRWLNSFDISSIPAFGSSAFRIGSKSLPIFAIPEAESSEEIASLITIQPRVPLVDPAAEDQLGNRYYAVVYEFRAAGPADNIQDIGRETVLADYRTVKAFEMLSENLDGLLSAAKASNDLAPAVDAALALGQVDIVRPGVARNLLVRTEGIAPGRLAIFVEPGLNDELFRDAVMSAVDGLNELTTPEAVTQSPILVATALPGSKSIGIAKVIAPRPMTMDQFRAEMDRILSNESGAAIREALTQIGASPFSLESLADRYGYINVKKRRGQEDEANDAESETESTES